jgi:CDP-glycerol glycerophosphotransferase
MIQYLEIAIVYILRILFKFFYIFPVEKNKVVFISQSGRQFFCNPKYIFKYMIEHYGGKYDYVWCLNDKNMLPDEYRKIGVKTVIYSSIKYIYHVMTAGFIISNRGSVDAWFPARKSQINVNTWHGGGSYKKASFDSPAFQKRRLSIKSRRDIRAKMTSYVISSCEKFTRNMSVEFNVPENKFLPIGMPRNDIFFVDTSEVKQKVYEYYRINTNTGIVLYAPTFRGDYRFPDEFNPKLDSEKILKELTIKYSKNFALLHRLHAGASKRNSEIYNSISVSDYPDMQELLCAADVLITDYSSSIWDFSFTYKPCFLYTPDLTKYEIESGFHVPIKTWPFPLAETNDELAENIRKFDSKKYINDINKHHKEYGSYETGHATEQFCKFLFGK